MIDPNYFKIVSVVSTFLMGPSLSSALSSETCGSSEVKTDSFLAEGFVSSGSSVDVNPSIQYRKTGQTQLEPEPGIVFSSSDSEDHGKLQITGITQEVTT